MPMVMAGLLACLSLLAQSTSPQRPAAPTPVGTAQISGTIRSAADDRPLARARVVATADVLPEPRATITTSDGGFTFTDLPAGSYIVSATRTGFAAQAYGQARSMSGTPIVLSTAQHIGNVDIALKPGGVIVGLILDEDGSPFAGAVVEALVTRVESGTRTLYTVATAQTDDRGEFRLFGLGPGEYYVSAQDPAFRAVSSPKGVLRYSPTYYPGTPLADQAKTVTVGATGTPRVEFKIALMPPARLSGKLIAFDGKPLMSAALVMSPFGSEGLPGVAPEDVSIQPDGRFTFGRVVPGRYQIRARGQTSSGVALFAVFPAEVIGADVEGIELTLRPGALVEGRVIVENKHASKPPALSTLRVRAPFTDGSSLGDALTSTLQPDGSFAIRGVMSGLHQFVIEGLPQPWVLKSVMLHGADVTDLEVPMTAFEQIHDLRLTITDASSEVSGVVQNARNMPAPNVGVIVFSKAPLFWVRTNRRMRVTFTGVDGRFSVSGLPAGDYFAVASDAIDEADLGHRERLEALQAYAVAFRLATDDGRATVTLRVAPAVPPSGAASTPTARAARADR